MAGINHQEWVVVGIAMSYTTLIFDGVYITHKNGDFGDGANDIAIPTLLSLLGAGWSGEISRGMV